ncbi:MAG TPA: homoserine dehydrogenase [Chloroflexota bacterium]|nr:homoserine dehydrogenase [Chloroflexota bacterium]
MTDSINVGLLGHGVVGGGVARTLRDKVDTIARRVGRRVVLRGVLVRDPARHTDADWLQITADPAEVLDDPDVHIIAEMMGGEQPAHDFIRRAIANGKHVVTANKEVMAKHGPSIVAAAASKSLDVAYEASVGGGIPVIGPFKLDLLANDISRVAAIINGTTNYIITRMSTTGLDFGTALKEAQDLGYAEPDPTNDVEGIDAAYKLSILSTLAFHARVHPDQVYREGITGLQPSDFRYARELGYAIRLLAIAKLSGGGLEARVHPTLVPAGTMLASVDDVYNAVQVEGDLVGRILFYGRGAGAGPTASAVVADIIDLAQRLVGGAVRPTVAVLDESIKVRPMDDVQSRYYLRLVAADRPGVIAQIAGIFGQRDISLTSVIQKEDVHHGGGLRHAEIVFMTHQAHEASVQQALAQIRQLEVVDQIGSVIRVED